MADPRIRLLDHISNPVIPSETVKALYRNPGLVRRVTYRPSLETQFKARVRGLSRALLGAVERLAADPEARLDGLDDQKRIAALDAAADLVDMRFADEIVFQPGSDGSRRKQRLLERRAAIRLPSAELGWRALAQGAAPVARLRAAFGLAWQLERPRCVRPAQLSASRCNDHGGSAGRLSRPHRFEFLPLALRFQSSGDAPGGRSRALSPAMPPTSTSDSLNRPPPGTSAAGVRRLTEDECSGCMRARSRAAAAGARPLLRWTDLVLATLDTMTGGSARRRRVRQRFR